jgi:hypothetical protein
MTTPTCQATNRDAPCSRPATWTIVARNGGDEVIETLYSCDDSFHQAVCAARCWQGNHVALVSTNPIENIYARPAAVIEKGTESA